MPPEDRPQPSADEVSRLIQWIKLITKPEDCAPNLRPGRVTIRRLNRTEYNNTIRDLIGIDFHPADDFPSDDVGYGFDNIGDVLSHAAALAGEIPGRGRDDQRASDRRRAYRERARQDLHEREPGCRRRGMDPWRWDGRPGLGWRDRRAPTPFRETVIT